MHSRKSPGPSGTDATTVATADVALTTATTSRGRAPMNRASSALAWTNGLDLGLCPGLGLNLGYFAQLPAIKRLADGCLPAVAQCQHSCGKHCSLLRILQPRASFVAACRSEGLACRACWVIGSAWCLQLTRCAGRSCTLPGARQRESAKPHMASSCDTSKTSYKL